MIYYIYKVRRKQTSIHFFRSVPTHRYLRSISWISWNGGHRPQQAGSSIPCSALCRSCARIVFAAVPIPKAAIAAPLPLLPPERQANALQSFPREKEKHLSPFFSRAFGCRSFRVALPASSSRVLPATHLRPVHLRPSHKQKNAGPRHCAANPLTTFVKRAQKA